MNTIVTNYGELDFQPLHDRVLIKRIPQVEGIIYIPDVARENSQMGEVKAMGKKVFGLKLGDVVLLPGIAAKYPDWEQSELILVKVADIGGIFEPDQA